ncbi:MAG: hypothetical protein ACSHX3_01875 [Litorimonas sp.]
MIKFTFLSYFLVLFSSVLLFATPSANLLIAITFSISVFIFIASECYWSIKMYFAALNETVFLTFFYQGLLFVGFALTLCGIMLPVINSPSAGVDVYVDEPYPLIIFIGFALLSIYRLKGVSNLSKGITLSSGADKDAKSNFLELLFAGYGLNGLNKIEENIKSLDG